MEKELLGRTKGQVIYGGEPCPDDSLLHDCMKEWHLTGPEIQAIKSDVNEGERLQLKERVKYLEGRNKQLERENNRLTEKIKRYSCTIKTMLEVIKREEK